MPLINATTASLIGINFIVHTGRDFYCASFAWYACKGKNSDQQVLRKFTCFFIFFLSVK